MADQLQLQEVADELQVAVGHRAVEADFTQMQRLLIPDKVAKMKTLCMSLLQHARLASSLCKILNGGSTPCQVPRGPSCASFDVHLHLQLWCPGCQQCRCSRVGQSRCLRPAHASDRFCYAGVDEEPLLPGAARVYQSGIPGHISLHVAASATRFANRSGIQVAMPDLCFRFRPAVLREG
jgi:hypothetical protein